MAKTLATVFGIIFVLVGLLGFVPNPLVGPGALFEADAWHNLVHLLFGVILLVVAYTMAAKAGMWLKVLGVVYLILAVLGFFTVAENGELLGFVAVNSADHWLHLVLGIVLLVAAFWGKKGAAPMPPAPGSM